MPKPNKLTHKQQLFVEAYAGNATEAAIKAGYSKKTARAIGCELLTKPNITQIIAKREIKTEKSLIATREERQAFWTSVYNDPDANMNDRLRASELLGKSQADFTEKMQIEGNMSVVQMPTIKIDGKEKSFKIGA